jgi:hypothetical protein
VWIDTERGTKAISYFFLMAHLNMMEDEFCTRRIVEHKHAAAFLIHREMECGKDKEKQEEERAQKCKKVCSAKATFLKGGEQAIIKGKWPCLTQD